MSKRGLRDRFRQATYHIATACPHCKTVIYHWTQEGKGWYQLNDIGEGGVVEGECPRCGTLIGHVQVEGGRIKGILCA